MPRSSVYKALQCLEADGLKLATFNAAEGLHYGEPCTDAGLEERAAIWNAGASPSRARKVRHQLERERHVNTLVRQAIEYWERKAGH